MNLQKKSEEKMKKNAKFHKKTQSPQIPGKILKLNRAEKRLSGCRLFFRPFSRRPKKRTKIAFPEKSLVESGTKILQEAKMGNCSKKKKKASGKRTNKHKNRLKAKRSTKKNMFRGWIKDLAEKSEKRTKRARQLVVDKCRLNL